MELSPRLQKLHPSATLVMAQKARELKSKGVNVISLSLGQPDFQTPDFIKAAAKEAIDQNYNSYTPVSGYQELKEAIVKKFKRDNGLTYEANQIVVSTGAKQSLYNAIQSLVGEGDEVILPAPFWVSYHDIVRLAGGTVVPVKTSIDQAYKMTPVQLEEAITPKTKVLLFSSPCNPSGSVYTKKELEALASVLRNYPDIVVISDEIYELITFADEVCSMASIDGMYDRTITVNGLSKGFAMTGWRIGYIGAPRWIARACETLQGQVTSGTNSIAQRAAITALEADPSQVAYMKEAFLQRRALILALAQEVEGFKVNQPEGAFYLFPDVSAHFGKTYQGQTISSAHDLAMYFLEYAHVACVSGESFGSPNCLRFSYAASEDDLKEAFRRIKEVLR